MRKEEYIVLGIKNFSDRLEELFGKNLDYYHVLQIKNEHYSVLKTIEVVEQYPGDILLEELYKAFSRVGKPEIYGIYFEGYSSDVPNDCIRVDFPILSSRPILITNRNTQSAQPVLAGEKVRATFVSMLKEALRLNATDIHIVPSSSGFYTYFRIDGKLISIPEFLFSQDFGSEVINFLYYEASKYTKGEFNPDLRYKAQDARIDINVDHIDLTLRLSFVPSGWNEKFIDITMRLIKKSEDIKQEEDLRERLRKLGILEEDIEILEAITLLKGGLVIISGKTNSGKSYLANTILSAIKGKKIGTIEDPIEYFVRSPLYLQHQLFVSPDEKLRMDFDDYVKAFKRGDYDVIYVGEWRRSETLTESILEQSYAGQLVITTLHISESFKVFTSLENMYGVSPVKVKDILYLSYNQALVPQLCPHCKIEKRGKVEVDEIVKNTAFMRFPHYRDLLFKLFNYEGTYYVANPKGCQFCLGTGYKGRTPVYDYFIPHPFMHQFDMESIINDEKIRKKNKIEVFYEKFKQGLVDIKGILEL